MVCVCITTQVLLIIFLSKYSVLYWIFCTAFRQKHSKKACGFQIIDPNPFVSLTEYLALLLKLHKVNMSQISPSCQKSSTHIAFLFTTFIYDTMQNSTLTPSSLTGHALFIFFFFQSVLWHGIKYSSILVQYSCLFHVTSISLSWLSW